MTPDSLNIIAIIFYIISWVLIAKSVSENIINIDANKQSQDSNTSKKQYFAWRTTWAIALIVHILSIANPLAGLNEIAFDFFTLCSYVMWFISLILFISALTRKIQALAVVILPFTVLSIVMLFNTNPLNAVKSLQMNSGLGLHVLSSLLAYSTLMLATVQAILLAFQNNHLHKLHQSASNPNQSNFFRTLPALEDMEHFLFRLIGIGVLLLSVGLMSGFYYLDNLFGSNVAHKTILSILSWLVFSALLIGRWKYGWRGKTAVRWTLAGFIILALAFFGSKFIQEFIIEKDTALLIQQTPAERHTAIFKQDSKDTPHLFSVFDTIDTPDSRYHIKESTS